MHVINAQASNDSWQAAALDLLQQISSKQSLFKLNKAKTIELSVSNGLKLIDVVSIARVVCNGTNFYPEDILAQAEIDHWMEFSKKFYLDAAANKWALNHLERELSLKSFLVGKEVTLADIDSASTFYKKIFRLMM